MTARPTELAASTASTMATELTPDPFTAQQALRSLVALALLALLLPLAGCRSVGTLEEEARENVRQGVPVDQDGSSVSYDLDGFDMLEVGDAFDVTVERGDAWSVEVRFDGVDLEDLEVVVDGRALRLGLANEGLLDFVAGTDLAATVTMPRLVGVEARGASDVRVSGFGATQEADDVEVKVRGASSLEGDLSAAVLRIDAEGASTVRLSGTANVLEAEARGASEIDLDELEVEDASVEASGASEILVQVSGRLDAEASGASEVIYGGNPDLGEIETSGASEVRAR